jgi:hypothetical protein
LIEAEVLFRFMPSKIYLLLDGPPDDRKVFAAFSTREAAEAALILADEDGEVQEHVVDGPPIEAPSEHSLWLVYWYNTYFVLRVNAFWGVEDVGEVVYEEGDEYRVRVWARDKAHALELGVALIEQAMV